MVLQGCYKGVTKCYKGSYTGGVPGHELFGLLYESL
jgi:hypothetical protein